jgi:hypothetical protein
MDALMAIWTSAQIWELAEDSLCLDDGDDATHLVFYSYIAMYCNSKQQLLGYACHHRVRWMRESMKRIPAYPSRGPIGKRSFIPASFLEN